VRQNETITPAILWRTQYAVADGGQRVLLDEQLERPYARADRHGRQLDERSKEMTKILQRQVRPRY